MGQRTRCPCSTSASDSRRRVDPGKPRKTSNAPATENILSFNPTDLHDRGQHTSASPTQGAELTHQVPTQSLWRWKKRRCIVSPGVASIPVPCPFPRCCRARGSDGGGGGGAPVPTDSPPSGAQAPWGQSLLPRSSHKGQCPSRPFTEGRAASRPRSRSPPHARPSVRHRTDAASRRLQASLRLSPAPLA